MSLPLTIACNPLGERGVFLMVFFFDVFFDVFFEELDDDVFVDFSDFITNDLLADGRRELVGIVDVLFLLHLHLR